MNEYQKERRKAQRRRIPHTYASEVNRARQRINQIIALTRKMFQQLGGVDGAVREWVEAIQHAKAEGKSHLVVRSFMSIVELQKSCEKFQPMIEDMDQEELQEAIRAKLVRLIAEQPELALLAASQLDGWTVIPPLEIEREWEGAASSFHG